MADKDATVFQRSQNPRELVATARLFAASPDPADQAVVLQQLNSPAFLTRVSTEQDYMMRPPHGLDVARVVKTLMQQEHPAARATLVNLTQAEAFQAYEPLVELNIRALAVDRPASERTIAYWDAHSQPQSTSVDTVVEAIFVNRSEPALALFERKLNDAEQDAQRQQYWLRSGLLTARNDATVLAACERMLLQQTLQPRWHSALLEALFDYDEGWYMACKFPRPPARALATPEARDVLGRIGEHALTRMQLYIPGLRTTIKAVMLEIGREWDDDDDDATA